MLLFFLYFLKYAHHVRRRNRRGLKGGAAGGSVWAEVAGVGRSGSGMRGVGRGAHNSFFLSRARCLGASLGNDGRPSDASDVCLVALLNLEFLKISNWFRLS
jgi:hypothetical protein